MKPGDIIAVKKDIVDHWGIFALADNGAPCVIHNSRAHRSVVVTSLADFEQGQSSRVVHPVRAGDERYVVQRAIALIDKPYDLFGFNCQHAASYAQSGVAESPQLAVAAFSAAALLALVGGTATYVSRRPAFDARIGRSGGHRGRKDGRFAKRPFL